MRQSVSALSYALFNSGDRLCAGRIDVSDVSYYPVRPGKGILHGTKINFNFAKGVKEPSIDDQFGSLYDFLLTNGGQATVNQYGIQPIGAELSRSYDGGVEQSLFSERATLRVTYFHNEFGNQIEYVPASEVPFLLPNLSAAQQQQLEAFLNQENAYSLTLNSLSFRAQGRSVALSLLCRLTRRPVFADHA